MIVIGLTGGIGMGKTTLANQLTAMGAKLCHADKIVHHLLSQDKTAIAEIKKHFPDAVNKSVVDRRKLGDLVFLDALKRKKLEQLLHPRVIAVENDFIRRMRWLGTKIVVLDVPLLFETGGEKRCDYVVVASAPAFLQRQRVLVRVQMTEAKFNSIVALQMPDREKRRRADFVVETGLGRAHSFRQLATIMRKIL